MTDQEVMNRLVSALRTALCPGGGWNGMPKDMVATTDDCVKNGVCGCDQGAALCEAEKRAIPREHPTAQ